MPDLERSMDMRVEKPDPTVGKSAVTKERVVEIRLHRWKFEKRW